MLEKKKRRGVIPIHVKLAIFKLFLGLYYMSKYLNFHKEAFFFKHCLLAEIKILKCKEVKNNVGYINHKKKKLIIIQIKIIKTYKLHM